MAKTIINDKVELPKYKCICSSEEFYRDVLYFDKELNAIVNMSVCKECFEKIKHKHVNLEEL